MGGLGHEGPLVALLLRLVLQLLLVLVLLQVAGLLVVVLVLLQVAELLVVLRVAGLLVVLVLLVLMCRDYRRVLLLLLDVDGRQAAVWHCKNSRCGTHGARRRVGESAALLSID